ncbi:MAG: CPBP family intramembrane metalloprotease [Rhizobiales bacterium]|nr:CPBP family intramembrane metalloprotease [Hyphomicrobiales bacterium]
MNRWLGDAYRPDNPAGLLFPLIAAVMLIVVNQVLQYFSAIGLGPLLFGAESLETRAGMKAALVGILPVSLLTVLLALVLARATGCDPRKVLALRGPGLSVPRWVGTVLLFLSAMYAFIMLIVLALGLDINDYTPGPDGASPDSGSAGLVKETMYDIANEPWLFWLVLPSVVIGAPLAEEFVFRGHAFAALRNSKAGPLGAVLVTSSVWALLHSTEPWLSIGLIFGMGIALGLLLLRYGSIWVTVACHGVWNGIFALVTFGAASATP